MNETYSAGSEFVVDSGPQTGVRFPIDKPLITIGRGPENDITLNDEMVSKHHARVIVQGNNCLIEDLSSSNGTLVNGRQVNSHILAEGDRLYLGQTNITFVAGAHSAAARPMQAGAAFPAGAMPIPAGAPAPAAGARKKAIWIAVAVAGGLVVLAGLALLLVLVLKGGQDGIKPLIKLSSPASGLQVPLGLPVGTPGDVEIIVSASDNKGLDKVEVMVNDKVVETLKATKATRDSKTGGKLKEEDFKYKWSANAPGSYTLRAKAYDWKGNTGDSDPVTVNVVNGPEIEQAHKFCQQLDGLITEYVKYRSDFNRAYDAAKNGSEATRYAQAALVFNQVRQERISVQTRLASLPPPPPFAQAHATFNQQVAAAIQADELAILWARDMQTNYPYYESGFMSDPDPNNYEGKMLAASGASQSAGQAFKELYNGARAAQLKIGPGPDPTQ